MRLVRKQLQMAGMRLSVKLAGRRKTENAERPNTMQS